MFTVVVKNHESISTPFSAPREVNIQTLFDVRDVETQAGITHRAFRDSENRCFIAVGEEFRDKTIRITFLWAKILERGENELATAYLARMLFHFYTFSESLDLFTLADFTPLAFGEAKLYNSRVGLWNSDLTHFDFFGTPYFQYNHQIIFYDSATKVNVTDQVTTQLDHRVFFAYYSRGVQPDRFVFSKTPKLKHTREIIPGKLHVLTALLEAGDEGNTEVVYQ